MIQHAGPWKGLDEVELATLQRVWWFTNHRLMEVLGYLPPAEYEKQFVVLPAAPVAA